MAYLISSGSCRLWIQKKSRVYSLELSIAGKAIIDVCAGRICNDSVFALIYPIKTFLLVFQTLEDKKESAEGRQILWLELAGLSN